MSATSAPRPGWSLRRKAVTTGAVGILALGIYLGTFFDGFGLGSGFGLGGSGEHSGAGAGPGEQAPDTDGVSTDLGQPAAMRASHAAGAAGAATRPLAVLITADGYQLPRDAAVHFADAANLAEPLSRHFAPASLDDVVARAKETAGNAGGIRVLIYRHKASTVGLHGTLVHALQDAGLPSGALHVVTGFFD